MILSDHQVVSTSSSSSKSLLNTVWHSAPAYNITVLHWTRYSDCNECQCYKRL